MVNHLDIEDATTQSAEFWQVRFKQQRQLIAAMTSLLSRYGSTVDTGDLHRTFLLTLMGHFAVGDAALYVPSLDGGSLEPTVAYGRTPVSGLPTLPMDHSFVAALERERQARLLRADPREAEAGSPVVALSARFNVLAPLFLASKLAGVVLLGARLNGLPYAQVDMEILESLAAVSASTFNHAILHRNARLSAEELRKLLEVRADVIDRMSHEFRTPLTVLRAGIELLPAAGDGPQSWMAASVERLQQLVDSLLALSQNAGAGADVHESDPLAAVHEAIGTVASAAARKRIRLTVSSSKTAQTATTAVAPGALRLILDALLDNAVNYSPEATTVTVEVDIVTNQYDPERDGLRLREWTASTRHTIEEFSRISQSLDHFDGASGSAAVPAEEEHAARYVVIRVIDEGIGIPADEIEWVAEPFRQGSNCPDRGVKGKGLGLALAQRSTAAGGGFICCRSSLGAGTTVSVFLPVG